MKAAVIFSLMGFSNLPGRLVVGKISDLIGRRQLAIMCALIQFGSLLWLIWADEPWMFYPFGIAFGFLWGGLSTMTTSLVGDVFGMRNIGIIMGMMSGGWALGAAIGPAIGGAVFDLKGDYSAAFAGGAVAVLIAGILVTLMRKKTNDT
jgi:MFS family permease